MTALQLYAVAFTEGHEAGPLPPGTQLVSLRDLGAIVAEGHYSSEPPSEEQLETYFKVIESAFQRWTLLPAPPGVVFRSRDALVRWMEIHYVTLTDALTFVEGRVEARVHIGRQGDEGLPEAPPEVAGAAADSYRGLRRHAVAAVPLRTDHLPGVVMGASFLLEREHWDTFREVVSEEGGRHPELAFTVTGPWPPFDFIRMQFGG